MSIEKFIEDFEKTEAAMWEAARKAMKGAEDATTDSPKDSEAA